MISVVVFKWRNPGYRSQYEAKHVNTLYRAIQRNYRHQFRLLCFTDDTQGLDPAIEAHPIWDDYASVPNPTWGDGPSCYRRLKVFSRDFQDIAGPHFVCVDLDVVITGDLTPLWHRPETFLMWETGHKHIKYCASMFMVRTGALSYVWETFKPERIPMAVKAGFRGSDQGWMQYVAGPDIAGWSTKDGVYGYKDHIARPVPTGRRQVVIPRNLTVKPRQAPLPQGARLVMFTGKPDYWDPEAQAISPWILEHTI